MNRYKNVPGTFESAGHVDLHLKKADDLKTNDLLKQQRSL